MVGTKGIKDEDNNDNGININRPIKIVIVVIVMIAINCFFNQLLLLFMFITHHSCLTEGHCEDNSYCLIRKTIGIIQRINQPQFRSRSAVASLFYILWTRLPFHLTLTWTENSYLKRNQCIQYRKVKYLWIKENITIVVNWFTPVGPSGMKILYDNRVNTSVANLTVQQRNWGNEQMLFNKFIN